MKLSPIPILIVLCFATPLFASEADPLSPEDQLELEQLMEVLDKHTEIATFTRMNADYIPGMVTVLDGRDVEAKGKHNVMEALTLVPGLDISLSRNGTPSMVSRGIGSPYLPATSLVMLDGVTMNCTTSGIASITFGIPIAQIDRIEVIRGPGTSVNGEFAYNSVINIITRKDTNTIHGSFGSFHTYDGGGIASFNDADRQMQFTLNMATSGTDGASHSYGPDNFGNFGKTNEKREMDSAFATFKYRNFSISGSYLDAGQGEFFQPFPNHEDTIISTQAVTSIEAQQRLHPSKDLNLLVKFGWQHNENDVGPDRLAPPGFTLVWPPFPSINYPDGVLFGFYNEEEKIFSSLETTWRVTTNNTLTFAINYNYTHLKQTDTFGNFDPDTYQPTAWHKYPSDNNFMDGEATRKHYAFALQDEYHLTSTLSIMAGLRYDHYSDVKDDQFTPRISGIWQPYEHHIFKFQYARAFRPPTLTELTGNANFVLGSDKINSEIIDTFELGYIFRAETIIAKLSLFYSDLDELIRSEATSAGYVYSNNASASQTGFEIEYKQDLLNNLELNSNLSYARTKDRDTREEVPNGRNWLLNLGLTYSPLEQVSINTQYRYVSERFRAPSDTRKDLQSYDVVDATLSFFPAQIPGLTVRTGLKNIFDKGTYVSSKEGSFYTTSQGADYPVLDRFWWTKIAYDF